MESRVSVSEKAIGQFKKNDSLKKDVAVKAKYPDPEMEIVDMIKRDDVLTLSTPVGGGDDDD